MVKPQHGDRILVLKPHWLEQILALKKTLEIRGSKLKPGRYFLGMVDVLQEWDWHKRLERLFKVWVLRRDPRGISAAPPLEYAQRFKERVKDVIEHDEPELQRLLDRSSLYSFDT